MSKLLIAVLAGGLFVLGSAESAKAGHCCSENGYSIGGYSARSYSVNSPYRYSYGSRPYYGNYGSAFSLGFGLGHYGYGDHYYGHRGYGHYGGGHYGGGHYGGGHSGGGHH